MPKYSYAVAKEVLTENDKNRILAIYLSMDNPNATTNWAQATCDFACASEDSMKVMLRSILKKVTDASNGGTAPTGTPKAAKGGRKRKSPPAGEDDGETKPKTPRKSRAKKPKAEPVDDDDEDADMGAVAEAAKAKEEINDNINVKMQDCVKAESDNEE